LVRSLDDLCDAELLIVGHHFDGVAELLEKTRASIIDLNAYPTESGPASLEREPVLEYGN